MDNYVVLEEISQTHLARVVKAKNKKTKEIVALKIITEKKVEDAPSKETLRELLVLMNFEHANIVQFKSIFVNKSNVVIEQEYCVNNLYSIITTISKPFTIYQIKKIMKSIADGLKFLHDNEILNRDIKPSNILIDDNCIVKLCDFGSSRIFIPSKPFTAGIGTKWYKSPEMLLGKKMYDKKIDIWSLGCVFAELFLLEPLFPGMSDFEVLGMIVDKIGYSNDDDEYFKSEANLLISEGKNDLSELIDQATPEAIDLIKKLLIFNPSKRLNIEEVLLHSFFESPDSYMSTHLPV